MRAIAKSLYMLVLACLCLLAAAATPALATLRPEWQECAKGAVGMFEDEKCTKSSTEGTYEWGEETKSEVTSSGKVELVDLKAEGAEKPSELECEVSTTGTIGNDGEGSESEVKFTKCEVVKGPCEKGTAKVTAINLPWATQLEEEEEKEKEETVKIRDNILAGSKAPGFKVECDVAKVLKVDDECVGATSTSTTNNESAGTVKKEFDSISKKGECKLGGANSGEIKGSLTTKGKMAIQDTMPTPRWMIAGTRFDGEETISLRPVTGTNEKFINARIEVECKTTTTGIGSIFAGRAMELRSVKFANCTVPSPAGCSVTGGTITPSRQLAQLRWSAATGEAASISFFNPAAPTPIAEFVVAGGGCTVAGTYKLVGEYVGELIISTTEESTKQFQMKCPTPIGSYWFGAQRRDQIELREPLKLGLAGALEAAKFCDEYEFSLAGTRAGSNFSARAPA
jgi:hypothetical protein